MSCLRPKLLIAFLVLPLLILGLAACGSDDGGVPGTPVGPSGQANEVLVELMQTRFTGETNDGEPRFINVQVRDNRQTTGFNVLMEFNGDEYDSIVEEFRTINTWMANAYADLFTSGHDVAEGHMSARMQVIGRQGTSPNSIVYKTRLKREDAEGIDWANVANIDFREIWDVLILNPTWRQALTEAGEISTDS